MRTSRGVLNPLPLRFATHTAPGPRPVNEDLVHADPDRGLFFVADGCGGQGKGDLASQWVLEAVQGTDDVLEALRQANARILAAVEATPGLKGMGATVAVATLSDRQLDLYHLGEVRAYRVRGNELTRLTEDHTLAAQLVMLKQIPPEAAATHPGRKTLVRYLGKDAFPKIDHQRIDLEPGDTLILCSDGFYSSLPSEALVALAGPGDDLAGRLGLAEAQVSASGGDDNLGVVVVQVAKTAPAPSPSEMLRGLLNGLLASRQPREDLAALAGELLGLVNEAACARGSVLVSLDGSLPQVLGRAGSQHASWQDLEAHPSWLQEARAGQPVAHPSAPLWLLSSAGEGPRVFVGLELAGQQRPELAAIAPYLELAAWLAPFARVVALRAP